MAFVELFDELKKDTICVNTANIAFMEPDDGRTNIYLTDRHIITVGFGMDELMFKFRFLEGLEGRR